MTKTTQLTALIVDDEIMARENLRMMIEDFCPEIRVIGTAENAVDAEEKIKSLNPQVVFLDIRMPSGTEGFQLLDAFEKKDFQVVFVTAFKDYAIQALNANAIHYILKPIDIDDLKNAVGKLLSYHSLIENDQSNKEIYSESIKNLTNNILGAGVQKKITLYHSKGFRIVELEEIVRMEANGNYTIFHFTDGSNYTDSKTLKFYDDMLKQNGFQRIHKSHMINMNCLKGYLSQDGHIALLENGDEIPISRSRLSEFLTSAKNL